MANLKRGDIVEMDGQLAVVVGGCDEQNIPEGHIELWFGEPRTVRKSNGGKGGHQPEIWIVPAEYVVPAALPIYKH